MNTITLTISDNEGYFLVDVLNKWEKDVRKRYSPLDTASTYTLQHIQYKLDRCANIRYQINNELDKLNEVIINE